MRLVLSFFCMLLFVNLNGQTAFSALLEKTDNEVLSLYEVALNDIIEYNSTVSKDGFELIDLEFYDGKCYGTWEKTDEIVNLGQADSWEAFQELKKKKIKEGKCLSNIETYQGEDGSLKIIGLWQSKKKPHNVWKLPNLEAIEFHYKELSKLGMFLTDIEPIEQPNGSLAYLALYHKGIGDQQTHFTQFANADAFNKDREKRFKSGYACLDLEVAVKGGIPVYMTIYQKIGKKQALNYQLEFDGYLQFQEFMGSNFKPVDLELNDGPLRPYASPFNMRRVTKTPDGDMKKMALSTKSVDGKTANQSAAVAAANGLVWLSQRGFDALNPTGIKQGEKAATTIARTLADGNHMKTLIPNKSNDQTIIEGLSTFINKHYEINSVAYYGVGSFDPSQLTDTELKEKVRIESNLDNIPLQKAKEGLTGSTIVMVKWGIYEPAEDDIHLQKKSENWGTLVGYGTNEHGVEKPDIILVHDPTDGEATRDKYFKVESLEDFFMMTDKSQLVGAGDEVISANKKQFLSYYQKDDYNSFAVWEGLVIVKVGQKK